MSAESILAANQKLLALTPASSGRTLKEDGTTVNLADLVEALRAAVNADGQVDALLHGTDAAGNPEAVGIVGGAARTTTGTGKGSKTRRLDLSTTYAAATNSTSFTEADDVRQVYLTFIPDAAGIAGDLSQEVIITFDATSEAVEAGWLAQGADPTLIWPNISIPVNAQRMGPYTFSGYLSRVGAVPNVLGELVVEAN